MIVVKICRGTVCHVMGGSDLPLLGEFMPEDLKNQVIIEGASCLDNCNSISGNQKPPYVDVNGTIVPEATLTKIIDAIRSEIKK